MVASSFWHVTAEDIGRLDAREAVAVTAELLRSEAHLDVPAISVSVPSEIDVADGGLDAEVRNATADGELIVAGVTGYQIKTGDFKLRSGRSIRELLLRPRSASKTSSVTRTDVNERVLGLAEERGTLVVVLFGSDAPPTGHDDAWVKEKIGELLSSVDPSLSFRDVRILRQNQIAALINRHAGLALRVKRRPGTRLRPLESWARLPDMRTIFASGSEQERFMAKLRALLAESSPRAIRILGEPGVGKSRLVLEALKAADDLRPLVVYAEEPETLRDGVALSEIEGDRSIGAVLVVDECSPEERNKLLRRIGSGVRQRVRIVTIHNDWSEQDEADRKLEAPRLRPEDITQILKGYADRWDLPEWADWCDGSARMAHIVGIGLRDYPDSVLSNRDGLLDTFLRGVVGDDQRARTVVLCLALFRKFGFAHAVSAESDFIYKHVVRTLGEGISKVDYNRTIESLRRSRILQGSSTLYFTPRLLHIWLWSQWWTISNDRDYLAIWEALQGQQALMDWFADMLAYARESQPLVAAILTLFGPNGSLHAFPNVPGKGAATLFLHAARVAPSEALTVLERNLGRRTTDELRDFAAGRHEAVHALRIIARDARLFDRAAKLLLRLAEAENQTYSNNATGMIKDLFRLGYGDAASSQLEPKARLPVLLEIARSRDPVHRGLALGAFEAALETRGSFVASIVDHPLQGAPNLWTPRPPETSAKRLAE